jgi:ABC-type antimicrobial peptide transport system permease subunit
VVGIVDDVRQASLRERPMPALYQPYRQVTRPGLLNRLNIAVAVAPGAVGVESALRRSLQAVDPQLAPTAVAAMDELVGATIAEPRFHARLMAAFSLLALLLSAVGLYGVLSTAALERQREMGIRMALGAGRMSIAWMMVRRALVLGGVGLALGLVGGVAFGQVLTSLLFDVTPRDSVTLAVSAGIVLAVVIVSAWAPAARASRSDPLTVLRAER